MVARDDPLDTYLVHHPDALLGRPVEATVLDPDNPLRARTAPVRRRLPSCPRCTEDDLPAVRARRAPRWPSISSTGRLLRRRSTGLVLDPTASGPATWPTSARGGRRAGGLVEEGTGRVLGTVDDSSAHATVHEGAVYVHQGETWLVPRSTSRSRWPRGRRADPDYSTSAREVTDIEIVGERADPGAGEHAPLSLGRSRSANQVVSFLKRAVPSGEVLGEEPLDLPPRQLQTTAVWWTLARGASSSEPGSPRPTSPGRRTPPSTRRSACSRCSPPVTGGTSVASPRARHADTGRLTVFVHDGHPGGAGFAERGFHAAASWLRATREAIASCGCARRMPLVRAVTQVRQPEQPARQAGAIRLLDLLLIGAPAGGA